MHFAFFPGVCLQNIVVADALVDEADGYIVLRGI